MNELELLRAQVAALTELNAQLLAIISNFADWKPQPITIHSYNTTTSAAEGGTAKTTSRTENAQTAANPHTIQVQAPNGGK